jgi:hypothetical protein
MKTIIETYRGYEISFDSSSEEFYCLSDTYDNDFRSKSFSALKKKVDDFLKENQAFKPFVVSKITGEKARIVGIRKDNRFIIEGPNGEKDQLSRYDEHQWFIYKPEQEEFWVKYQEINSLIDDLRKEREAIEAKFEGTLKEFKKTL